MNPRNLKECFEALDILLSAEDKKFIDEFETENKMCAECHFGLGRWMRNNWGLWKSEQLAKYFNVLGIEHPDDMSGIILVSYWRNRHNKPLDIDKQVKYYQEYWKKNGGPTHL